jgi:hypothetical protein
MNLLNKIVDKIFSSMETKEIGFDATWLGYRRLLDAISTHENADNLIASFNEKLKNETFPLKELLHAIFHYLLFEKIDRNYERLGYNSWHIRYHDKILVLDGRDEMLLVIENEKNNGNYFNIESLEYKDIEYVLSVLK